MSQEVGEKTVRKIVFDAKKNSFEKITFKFAGGEPLLEFSLVLHLVHLAKKLAKKERIKVDFVVLTNGVLLTEKITKKLKNEGIKAAVSLDGLGKYNDAQRVFPSGKGSFKYVEKGIQNLKKARVPFNVSVTINSKNIENIPQLTRYLLKQEIPFAFNFYRESPYVSEKLEGDDKKLVFYLKKAYKIIYDNPPPYQIINGLLDRVSFGRPHLYPCGMGNSYIVVDHNGKITSCQMTLGRPIGSIEDDDLIEMMIKGNFVRPKNLTVDGKTPCKKCQWRYLCGG